MMRRQNTSACRRSRHIVVGSPCRCRHRSRLPMSPTAHNLLKEHLQRLLSKIGIDVAGCVEDWAAYAAASRMPALAHLALAPKANPGGLPPRSGLPPHSHKPRDTAPGRRPLWGQATSKRRTSNARATERPRGPTVPSLRLHTGERSESASVVDPLKQKSDWPTLSRVSAWPPRAGGSAPRLAPAEVSSRCNAAEIVPQYRPLPHPTRTHRHPRSLIKLECLPSLEECGLQQVDLVALLSCAQSCRGELSPSRVH